MTTITDMMAPRATEGPRKTALLRNDAERSTPSFAEVLEGVVDEAGRRSPARQADRSDSGRSEPGRPDRDEADRIDADEGVERDARVRERDADTEAAEEAGARTEEEETAQDEEQVETFVPIAEAATIPVDETAEAVGEEAVDLTFGWERADRAQDRTPRQDRTAVFDPTPGLEEEAGPLPVAGAQTMDGEMDSALDLLTTQELLQPDVTVDTEGGDLFQRLQQALNAGNTALADDVGEVVVPQVVRNMAALARNGVSEMRLQLQPNDLGEIELRVRAVEGMIRGEVMVQHPEVKQLLESQLDRLRTALAQQGLHLDGFDVDVSGRDAQPGGEGGDESARDGHPGRGPFTRLERIEDEPRRSLAPASPIRLRPDANDWIV